MRILLVDDDRNFISVLKQELEEKDFSVDLAANGVEAVLSSINGLYDFLLMDLRMPRLSGLDALKIIKRLRPDMPCITFSGAAGVSERTESIQNGAMKCLEKPFSITQLQEEIESYCGTMKQP